jgi:hypothetical protein
MYIETYRDLNMNSGQKLESQEINNIFNDLDQYLKYKTSDFDENPFSWWIFIRSVWI